MSRPTVVYLMRNADAEVIYVGITNDLKNRMRTHTHRSPWLHEVASIETSTPTTREDAMELEALYAAALRPRYNSQLVPGRRMENLLREAGVPA